MKSSNHIFSKKFSTTKHIIFSIGYLFLAFFFYASQLLYPVHGIASLVALYFLYRELRALYRAHNVGKDATIFGRRAMKFSKAHKVLIFIILSLVVIWYTASTLLPSDHPVFSGMTKEEQIKVVQKDAQEAAVLLDMLMLSGNELLDNPSLIKQELTQSERDILKNQWEQFLKVAILSEGITDRHRYFNQISIFSNKDTHIESFVIAYSLYIKKFELFYKVIARTSTSPNTIKLFNEYSPVFGVANLYDDVSGRFFASNSFLRRNVGYLYYKIMSPKDRTNLPAEYAVLLDIARGSYEFIFKNALTQVTHGSALYKNSFDRTMFGAWLPIQKTVFVNTFGNVHVGERKEKFISVDQINEMKNKLQPADILVYRKNWYVSNLGVPGFWTHAGLYTGTLDEMNAFFAPVFPQKGYSSFSALLQVEHPLVYEKYSKQDDNGFLPSVVESQTHGTLVQSIEHSASVDYFGVVRTDHNKQELLETLMQAFSHYGKPYDFSFDFDTKNEIFCSELVYDAYLSSSSRRGVTFPRIIVSGKNIVIPQGIVEKFANERNTAKQELFFVYFLDASEDKQEAFIGTEAGFIDTISRSKYSSLQQ